MSFEGYYQIICEKGHLHCPDVYDAFVFDGDILEDWECPDCKSKAVWWNLVDVTNGSFYYDEEKKEEVRIDDYVELEEIQPATCKHCGEPVSIEPGIVQVPEKGGHRRK